MSYYIRMNIETKDIRITAPKAFWKSFSSWMQSQGLSARNMGFLTAAKIVIGYGMEIQGKSETAPPPSPTEGLSIHAG